MTKTKSTENWFSRGKAEADKGIPKNERIAGIGFFFTGSILIVLYLAVHQMWSTGFFTATFGTIEMIMLYGSWIAWIITAGLEGVLGQRLLSRLFDTFGGIIFIAVATAWLAVVFPFEFAYFADVLPDYLRFLVQWISNDIARIVMLLYTIAMGIAAVYAPIGYKFIRIQRFQRE
ncbi:MAG: hypothetical protein NWF10_00365 [Candidatus Bathyarchaeota archaeon]|nr:hypothetical protein [Candidatus Bathyarchaeota archaeon]